MSMARPEVIAHVNKILIDEFEIPADKLSEDRLLREDLDLDSLDAVDMIVALEQGLKIRVNEEEARKIRSLGDVYAFVERMLAPAPIPSVDSTSRDVSLGG